MNGIYLQTTIKRDTKEEYEPICDVIRDKIELNKQVVKRVRKVIDLYVVVSMLLDNDRPPIIDRELLMLIITKGHTNIEYLHKICQDVPGPHLPSQHDAELLSWTMYHAHKDYTSNVLPTLIGEAISKDLQRQNVSMSPTACEDIWRTGDTYITADGHENTVARNLAKTIHILKNDGVFSIIRLCGTGVHIPIFAPTVDTDVYYFNPQSLRLLIPTIETILLELGIDTSHKTNIYFDGQHWGIDVFDRYMPIRYSPWRKHVDTIGTPTGPNGVICDAFKQCLNPIL